MTRPFLWKIKSLFDSVLQEVDNFTNVAGLELNLIKWKGCGQAMALMNQIMQQKRPSNPVKCLGICNGRNVNKLKELNWDNNVRKES